MRNNAFLPRTLRVCGMFERVIKSIHARIQTSRSATSATPSVLHVYCIRGVVYTHSMIPIIHNALIMCSTVEIKVYTVYTIYTRADTVARCARYFRAATGGGGSKPEVYKINGQ